MNQKLDFVLAYERNSQRINFKSHLCNWNMNRHPQPPPNHSTSTSQITKFPKRVQLIRPLVPLVKSLRYIIQWKKKPRIFMSLKLSLPQSRQFCNKVRMQGSTKSTSQAHQYITSVRFLQTMRNFIMSRCTASKRQEERENKTLIASREISLGNACDHVLAPWAHRGYNPSGRKRG